MKIEVKENEAEKELQFPCLMISSDGSIILAFELKREGVLSGCYLNNEDSCFDDEFNLRAFKPFKGSITLSND